VGSKRLAPVSIDKPGGLSHNAISALKSKVANRALDCASFLSGMRLSALLTIGLLNSRPSACVYKGKDTQNKDAQIESKGMPPRAAPSDYQARLKQER